MMACWQSADFQPISFCNTYSLHLLEMETETPQTHQLVLDINGTVHWFHGNGHRTVSLKQRLDAQNRDLADFDLELVASDLLWSKNKAQTGDALAYIGTCWVVYDQLFAPERQFAALFIIRPDCEIELAAKFDLPGVPTFTRLTREAPTCEGGDAYLWLVFTYSRPAIAYSVRSSGEVLPIAQLDPLLSIPNIPGSGIRTNCAIKDGLHFSLVGYDTGYVIASVCPVEPTAEEKTNASLDRKSLKFDGPISVMRILQMHRDDDEASSQVFLLSVLISSTIGPVTVWTLRMEQRCLHWELASVLSESELYDTVMTAAVHPGHGQVLVGTYAEHVLVYDLSTLLQSVVLPRGDDVPHIAPQAVVNIASPILAIAPLGEELLVLSNRGLHRLHATSEELLAQAQNSRKPSNTPTFCIASSPSGP